MTAWVSSTFRLRSTIGSAWCSLMHDSPRWPIRGHYECGICGRRYRVPWAGIESPPVGRVRQSVPAVLSFVILPVLILPALFAWPVRGAERRVADDSTVAAVLQRFILNQQKGGSWPLETIDIEASLPGLEKTGTLRAIRRLSPVGAPDYRVLEIGGDPTVKRQVISRYLSADERATALPASSVAVTPANYRISYIGPVTGGSRLAYAFRMVPRKKREGLINGVVWLDSETAIALRESGDLAKCPSVFVKHIHVTRENALTDGKVAARVTHVTVDTRFVGRAQLVIFERPSSDELTARGTCSAVYGWITPSAARSARPTESARRCRPE